MKVYVWKDSAYPVYGIDEQREGVEIPDELYERYVKIEQDYNAVQEELGKYSCE